LTLIEYFIQTLFIRKTWTEKSQVPLFLNPDTDHIIEHFWWNKNVSLQQT